jgi:hypothetical protein
MYDVCMYVTYCNLQGPILEAWKLPNEREKVSLSHSQYLSNELSHYKVYNITVFKAPPSAVAPYIDVEDMII